MRRDWIDGGALFALLLLCTAYTLPRWADWNQNSRFDLTVAIVDHGTLSIDCCVANTGDYAVFEGRAYSDKAPGLSLLAVPAYVVFERLMSLAPVQRLLLRLSQSEALKGTLKADGTGLQLDKIHFFLGMVLATWLLVTVPSALAGVLLYFYLERITPRRDIRFAVTLAWSFGTNAFTYAGAFYAHQLVAAMLFTAFYIATRASPAAKPIELTAVGLLLGLAAISEYPTVLIGAPIALLACWRRAHRGDLAWIIAGGLAPLAVCAGYNLAIFGTPLPVGYRYSALWQAQHATGLISLTYPRAEAVWGLTFGAFRGLFLLSPVLLFGLAGLVVLGRERRLRAEVALSAWAVLSFLAFASSSSMWWGGFAVGPRYLVPMLPFLAWPAAAVLVRAPRPLRLAFAVALVLSIALVWGLSLAGQQFPTEAARFAWRDHAWPRLAAGDLARNAGMALGLRGWSSLLPLLGAVALVGATWRWLHKTR